MTNESTNQKGKGKAAIWVGVIVVVVAAVVIVSLTSFPPKDENVQGAIGAAEKYRAEQISDADVTVNETDIQRMLQDDKILALLEDKELMNAIAEADNETFRAIAALGPNMALALKEEAPEVLKMMQLMEPAELDAFRKAIPAYIDEVKLSPIDDSKLLMGIIRKANTVAFKAMMESPAAFFDAVRTADQDNLAAMKDAVPAHVFEALETIKADTYNLIKNMDERSFKAARDARPAHILAIREAAATSFDAFCDARPATVLALRDATRTKLEALRRFEPAHMASLQKASTVLMSTLQKVDPMFAQALAANPDFKKEMLQRANINYE
jgi:hypothetical protein